MYEKVSILCELFEKQHRGTQKMTRQISQLTDVSLKVLKNSIHTPGIFSALQHSTLA